MNLLYLLLRMSGLSRNMVLRLFMAVCALAQVAAVMPHHHHESSDAMCINPLHCLETPAHLHQEDDTCRDSGSCNHHGHDNVIADATVDSSRGSLCGGHLCLHNIAGHPNTGGGDDCSVTHLDLNPPAKDKVNFEVPVLELAGILIAEFPPVDPVVSGCGECGSGDCCCALSGTIALYVSYSTAAIPPRAPSMLV